MQRSKSKSTKMSVAMVLIVAAFNNTKTADGLTNLIPEILPAVEGGDAVFGSTYNKERCNDYDMT